MGCIRSLRGEVMKRNVLLFIIVTISIILIGCNIKIGDGVLTVSEDGVQYITSDQSEIIDTHVTDEDTHNGQKNDNKRKLNDQESTTGNSPSEFNSFNDTEIEDLKKVAEELAKIGEELWKNFSSEGAQSKGESDHKQCKEDMNQNYTSVQQKLNHEFYFPPCSGLISVKEHGSTLQFVLEQRFNEQNIEGREDFIEAMELIEAEYVELGGENVYENYIHYEDLYGEIKFHLHGDEQGHTHVYFKYWGDHIEITVTYKHTNSE